MKVKGLRRSNKPEVHTVAVSTDSKEAGDLFRISKVLPRRRINQNVFNRLRSRETHAALQFTFASRNRKMLENVHPTASVIHVDKPGIFLRKFTPDGKAMLAFLSTVMKPGIEVYHYNGCQAAGNLLSKVPPGPSEDDSQPNCLPILDKTVRKQIFNSFFTLKFTLNLSYGTEQICRDCSLFTPDSRFTIVAGSSQFRDDFHTNYVSTLRNNESLDVVGLEHRTTGEEGRIMVENYSIYCVDLQNATFDVWRFTCDRIVLTHNQGLYLVNRTLAILSIHHQTIHLFQITSTGKLVHTREIGRFCFEDDELLLSRSLLLTVDEKLKADPNGVGLSNGPQSSERLKKSKSKKIMNRTYWTDLEMANRDHDYVQTPAANEPNKPPQIEPFFGALKQRFLSYMFREALHESEQQDTQFPIRDYFRFFPQLAGLKIWRMQLLDEDHLLLRYTDRLVVLGKEDYHDYNSFFVFYKISTAQVLKVHGQHDAEVLEMYEQSACDFRQQDCWFPCNISCSVYAKQHHDRFKETVGRVKNGDMKEAIRRLASFLPLASQSFNTSPYLDLQLFKYDEKYVASLERPKPICPTQIRFFSRETDILKFGMFCGIGEYASEFGLPEASEAHSHHKLVVFIFHPFDPFAISIQRYTNTEYVVNFHVTFYPDDNHHSFS